MKKLMAVLLVLFLLLPSAAFAAEAPEGAETAEAPEGVYLRQLPQYEFIGATLVPEEFYPEANLMAEYEYKIFTDYEPIEPMFVCFPGPEGAMMTNFDSSSVQYIDEDNSIVYTYVERKSDSFEEFVNEAEEDEYIILDGSDGVAAFIDPEDRSAYGMIGTKDFGKSAKLILRIELFDLDGKMPLDTRVKELTDAIVNELGRLGGKIHVETYDAYWSAGKYTGAKLLEPEFQSYCHIDFPALEVGTGDAAGAEFILTAMDEMELDGIYDLGGGNYVETEIEVDSYSYPASLMEQGEEGVRTETLENGSEWIVYFSGERDDGTVYSWYASKALEGFLDRYEDQYYLSYRFGANGDFLWEDEAACLDMLLAFDDSVSVVSVEEDPYVPGEGAALSETGAEVPAGASAEEVPAEETPAGAETDGAWTCPECGEENTGNFCSNCGAAKP